MRFNRVAAALLLALAACNAPTGPDGSSIGGGLRSPTATGTKEQPRSDPAAPSSPSTDGTRGRSTAGSVPGSTTSPASYFDDAGVGAMARRYLQPSPARSIVIEIDYVDGRRPSSRATDHVRSILERETGKPVRIDVDDRLPEAAPYSVSEIERLASRHRDNRSQGGTATMWIAYLDGSLQGESSTVGMAVTASTAVVFYDHVRNASTAVVGASQIERAVLTHEVGHLLALVNIGYTSRHDHEDPEHPGHSKSRKSVMYWQIEDAGLVGLITGGPAVDFDEHDRADLAMLRQT